MTRANPGAVVAALLVAVLTMPTRAESAPGKADFDRALALYANDTTGMAGAKALPLYKRACLAGYAHACTEWGNLRYFADGVPMELLEAGQAYQKGCTAGAARACFMLAHMKESGIGFEVDASVVPDLLERACEIGGPPACRNISRHLSEGGWLNVDEGRAKDFNDKACKGDIVCSWRNRPGAEVAPRDGWDEKAAEFKGACGGGDNDACLRGGLLLREYGDQEGVAQAIPMFDLACKAGLGEACFARTQDIYGNLSKFDRERHLEFLTKGCDLGVAGACATISSDAFRRRGCVLGDPRACMWLGDSLRRQRLSNEVVNATYERACEFETAKGLGGCNNARMVNGLQDGERYLWTCKKVSREACAKAGVLYSEGMSIRQVGGYFGLTSDGVRAEPLLALDAFKTGCTKGDPRSCGQLAMLHFNGKGVARDESRAVKLWRKSCDDGDGMSCVYIGQRYTQGEAGFPRDLAAAMPFYEKGCSLGASEGCIWSGLAYWRGDGLEQDVDKAGQLFEKACSSGSNEACKFKYDVEGGRESLSKEEAECGKYAFSCADAADVYAAGSSVTRDLKKAAHFYEKACTTPTTARSGGQKEALRSCVVAAVYAEVVSDEARQDLFQKACERQSGSEAAYDEGGPRTGCTALACLKGDGTACVQFGATLWSYEVFRRGGAHRLAAIDWIEKGCSLGAESCASSVAIIRKDAVEMLKKQFGEAAPAIGRRVLPQLRRVLDDRCRAKDAQACLTLADMLKLGHGGSNDPNGAIALVRKACEFGSVDACITVRAAP